MSNFHLLFIFFILLSSEISFAQVGINTDNSDPDASAILDVKSTEKGMLIPRMTSAQRDMISNAAIGLLVFDITTETFWFNDSSGWTELVSGGTSAEIADADGDTKIQVEESADEDIIRFDVEGTQAAILRKVGTGGTQLTFSSNSNNILLGSSPINSLNGANNNTIMGSNAFLNATDGAYNTATGAFALRQNTSGSSNNVFGSGALQNNTTGSDNIAIGNAAGWTNQTGSDNIFIGNTAGYGGGVGTGARNVMIGKGAGEANSGSGNVFLGYQAGRSSNGSDKLFIDNTSTSSPLIYGEFNNNLLRVNGTFNINNAFSFPTTDGTANQVLQTDGSGTLAWADIAAGTQTLIEDADMDTKIQVEENADEDIIRFDIAGTEIFRVLKNDNGVTLFETPSSGLNSTLFGQQAGESLSSGHSNTFLGKNAGQNTASGADNTFVGRTAGLTNTTGSGNVFVGRSTGSNATGSNNVFLGRSAGFNSAGNDNVFLGNNAGQNNLAGDNNIFLGRNAGKDETGSNKLYIENSDSATPLIYGEFDNNLLRINGDLEVTGTFPGSDDQSIDVLNLNGNTLEISLEDDGEVTRTLDLSNIDTDTDNQSIDVLILNGNTLEISLEDDGQATQTLDLSGIDTDTDNQTIDKFNLNGSTLEISLEGDGEADKTVDLSVLSGTPSTIEDSDSDTKVEAIDLAMNDYVQLTIENTPKLKMTSRSLEFLNMGNSLYLGESAGTMDDYSNNQNVGIGFESLTNSTFGTHNIGIGYQTLKSLTSGQTSIAIGTQVLSKGNPFACIGIGYQALFENLNGYGGVAMGFHALKNNTNGNNNVAIGTNGMDTNTTGSNNTTIGYSADVGVNNLTNATAIGANAVVSQSNSVVLGNNVNVGIGTSTPDDKLHVVGDIKTEGIVYLGTNGDRKAAGSDKELVIVQGIATQNSDNSMSVTTSTSANVSSVTRNSEGTYTVNFAEGTFTLKPAITITPYLTASNKIPELTSISSSSFQVRFRNPNGNNKDSSFSFIAVGIAP